MLTKPQKESEEMQDLKRYFRLKEGIVIYTASTMEEQRDIAEYINKIDGEDYVIWDFSKKETHPMGKNVLGVDTAGSKLIITNMQEIGLAPYCKSDSKATVTLDDKIQWYNSIPDELSRHEGKTLQMINMLRDTLFVNRKIICGMHPKFLDKMEYRPYFDFIDDWLDYAIDRIRFDKNPEFTQSLPISKNSNNPGEVQARDMVFTFQNRIVRWPNYDSFKQSTREECIERLSQLPEISLPSNIQNDIERIK